MQQERSRKNYQKLLKLFEKLTNRGYDKNETMSHISKAIAIFRNEILNKKTKKTIKKALIVTFNRTLPDLKHVNNKNSHIFSR